MKKFLAIVSLLTCCIVGFVVASLRSAENNFIDFALLQRFLSYVEFTEIDDGSGNKKVTIRITGANLQIVDGSGDTTGTINGLGNLIIGYNESGHPSGDGRTGSHNLIIGSKNNYKSFGGITAGFENEASNEYATVTGGRRNKASGKYSSVAGGGTDTVASGNTASGEYAFAAGGRNSTASQTRSVIVGGQTNTASGNHAVVLGGTNQTASGDNSTITGGNGNTASGENSSVSGGNNRSVSGLHDWRAGTLFEDN